MNKSSIVHRLESTLGLDVRYFGKNFTWMSIGQGVSALASFVTAVAFSRFLSKELFGQYTYTQSLFQLFGFFGLSGMGVAVVRAVSRNRTFILPQMILLTFLSSIFGMITLVIFAIFIVDTVVAKPLLLLAFVFPFYHGFKLYSSDLQGKKQFRRENLLNLIPTTITSVLLVLLLSIGIRSVLVLIAVSIIPEVLFRAFYTLTVIQGYSLQFSLKGIKKDALYGLKLSITEIPALVAFHFDKVLIGAFLTVEDLAIFSFAVAIPELLKGFLKNISSLSLPKLSEQKQDVFRLSIRRHYLTYTLFLLPLVGSYIIVAPFLFKLLFPEYSESISLSRLFSVSLLALPMNLITSFFQAQGFSKKLLNLNLLYSVLQVSFLLILTPTYGILGAILARIISRFSMSTYAWYQFLKIDSQTT